MLQHIGTALHQQGPQPDRVPVRRHSHMAGRCEGVFWRPTNRRAVRRIVLGARRLELATRAPGRRNGVLGHVAIEVLDLLGNLVSFKSGRLEPSLAYLMQRLRRSKDAVVRALAALRVHGFLDWLRRFERIDCDGPGPRVRQVSNAYRMVMPARALRLLGVSSQDAPLPHDTRAERRDWSVEDLPLAVIKNDRLACLLGEMGRRVSECESGKRSEP